MISLGSCRTAQLLFRLLPLPESAIGAALLQQLVVVPLLHEAAAIQHQDAVAGGGGRELVADHQDRAVLLAAHGLQDVGGGVVVHAGQGVVEH